MNGSDPSVSQLANRADRRNDDVIPTSGKLFLRLLQATSHGSLMLTLPNRETRFFSGTSEGPRADLQIHDWRAVGKILRSADIGLAEAYRDDWISTDSLTHFLEFCIGNEAAFEGVFYGRWWTALLYRLAHALRPNTRAGSKRNIHAHYDLGNAFYGEWLDSTMTYSAAVFKDGHSSDLASAQEAKYERICCELNLTPGMRVLEIGCGWGGFAEYAARTRGVHLLGITISQQQLDYARARIVKQQLTAQVDLQFLDYRDTQGQFDAVVSIEMFEAVGERYWPSYFKTIHDRLKPGASAVVQAITIDAAKFETYRKTSDFIREFIFPGGMLASVERFAQEAQQTGLAMNTPFRFGRDYAHTLRLWLAQFNAKEKALDAQGFNHGFRQLWRFYFQYCEAGFMSGRTDVIHARLTRSSTESAH